ncbi:hypothetical protein A6V29_19940 [Blastococcus sp. CCUG 61487]|nr:hypothetical protein A6V29_19940 [Blastococcus sp. CCUG 61487]
MLAATSRRASASHLCCSSAWSMSLSSRAASTRRSDSPTARRVSKPARLARTAVLMNSNSMRSLSGDRENSRPLSLTRLSFSPTHVPSCLYWRTGKPSAAIVVRSPDRSSRSSSSNCSSGCS